MRLKAVLFDMGGTLDDYRYDRASARSALPELRALLGRVGAEAAQEDEALLALLERGEEAYRRFREATLIELEPEAAWRDYYLRGSGLLPGLTPELGEELAFLVDTRFHPRSLRPEAPEALAALKARGLKLGIVSNVLSRGQVRSDLERYGIAGLFDAVLTSSEFGRRKPDPAIFLKAAELVGAGPSECAYVGDRVSRDIVGARRAGYALAVRIRYAYGQSDEPPCPEPDLVVDRLDEILPALDRLEIGGTR
jgi:putative hydrolase of the HAD superfamily